MYQADREWSRVVSNILSNGYTQDPEKVRAVWKSDKTPATAKFVIGERMYFDGTEVPIIQAKYVNEEAARDEISWIWQKKSNVVQDLRDMGHKIWNEWEIKEGKWQGKIGPAYGYQLGILCRKFPVDKLVREKLNPKEEYLEKDGYVLLDQVDFLIQSLLNNPGSRRLIVSLWNIRDLDEMSLEPCVWESNWKYCGGKLNVIIGIRSNDMCLGNPFNIYQYYVLQRMIAQTVGMEVGSLQFNIDDAQVYERHIPGAIDQIKYANGMDFPKPKLWLNPDITNFYEFDQKKDIVLTNYHHMCGPKRKFEVAE